MMALGISEKAKLVASAKREFNGFKTKKAKVTTYLNKCQQLFDLCQVEAPLTKTSAKDALSLYSRTKICMNELETSVETYLDLMNQTYEELPPKGAAEVGDDGADVAPAPEVDRLQDLIHTHTNSLTVYSTRVINLRSNNIEVFRSIDIAMTPVATTFS